MELNFEDTIDELDELLADSQRSGPTDEQLKSISALVLEHQSIKGRISRADDWMKDAKKRVEDIEANLLPEVLSAAGVESFKTAEGVVIEVKPVVAGSIPVKDPAKKAAALEWLRKNGHGDLIKSEISISLGRGTEQLSAEVEKTLRKMGLEIEKSEGVHPQTLGAWAREMLAKAAKIPLDTLGIYVGRRATVKQSPSKQ